MLGSGLGFEFVFVFVFVFVLGSVFESWFKLYVVVNGSFRCGELAPHAHEESVEDVDGIFT